MRRASYTPKVHIFVCTNRRGADDPLGSGCGERGDRVYASMKSCVAAHRAHQAVWITQTGCLGVCPRVGATVAVYPEQRILMEVEEADVAKLYDEVASERSKLP